MSNGFAAVPTLPKADKKILNPRATRYGVLPIWPLQAAARDFAVWEIPANTVFPFRPFIGEIGQDVSGNQTYVTERMPNDQILDMYTLSQFFVELDPLAKLGDEEKAKEIAALLSNPRPCEKYPVELGNQCATCWYMDALTDMDNRIKQVGDADIRKAARECAALLKAGLLKSIEEARRQVDVAIRDIDDPKSGKSMFFDHDYRNVYHTHADRPTYKTSTNNTDIGASIAAAIQQLANKSEPAAPAVDIERLVTEAVLASTKDLRDKLAAYEAAAAAPAPAPEPQPADEPAPTTKKSK